MKRKNAISLVAFILCAILMTGFLSHLFRDKESSFDSYYLEPENTIDVLFVGSSHVYSGYCPAVLWQEYGVSSYNVYSWSTPIWTGYYYLCEALKTQSPEVVFVDMATMCTADGIPGAKEKGIDNREQNMWFNAGKERFLLTLESLTPDSETFDLELFHNKWKHPDKIEWRNEPTYDSYLLRNFGAIFEEYEFEIFNFSFLEDIYEPTKTAQKYLNKLVKLSEKENFKLVFVMTPYNANEQQNGVSNWLHAYAEQHGIDYIDFMQQAGLECGFDYQADMADIDHVNVDGALKLTRYCGDYLRSIGICERWDNPNSASITTQANAVYRMMDFSDTFTEELNSEKLFSWLALQKDSTTMVFMPDEPSKAQVSAANLLNIPVSGSTMATVTNGTVTEVKEMPSGEEKITPDNAGCSVLVFDDSISVLVGNDTEFFATDRSNICVTFRCDYWDRLVYAIEINPNGNVRWREYTAAIRGAAEN